MALYDVSTTEKKASPELVAGGTLYADAPIGTIIPFGGSSDKISSGWCLCDGRAVSRTTYSELFAVIGTAFGSGDGSTTFNLPDMRESVPKGAGLTGKSNNHYDSDGVALGEFIDDRTMSEFGMVTTGSGSYNVTNSTSGGTYYKLSSNRHGATTEVKSVGVNYIIKAKMIGVPADFVQSMGEFEKYSTDEVLTNKTWIDGKPIYRKVIEWDRNLGSVTSKTATTKAHGISNIGAIVKVEGKIYQPGSVYAENIPNYNTNNDYIGRVRVESTNVSISYIGSWADYRPCVILEYTKTTD